MDHFNIFFQYYRFEEVTSFAVFTKSDSARVNISLANILGIRHIPCDNNNLNLEVEDMHTNDKVICELVEEFGCNGSSVRIRCKKSALMRQFTNIRAVTTCKTFFTGSLICLSCHLKIYPGLEPISAEENTDDMEKILTASYLRQVKTKLDILKSIGDENTVIKTRGYTYSQGCDAHDLIIKEFRENKGNREHVLHGCKLGTKYIKADNHLSTDHQFAKGMYKISLA